MCSEGNVYNPVPERMPKARDADEFARIELRAIVRACDIRLHRSFILPPNPRIGRDNPIRVTYADVGYSTNISGEQQGKVEEEVPTLLWCGGQFGGRYQSISYDKLAKKHRVRLLAIDRPGIGGTQSVPLDQRIATWLDMVSALLDHVKIKYVHFASHSAGTIFVLNALLHLRHLFHPVRPYVALFGPWVPPSISGKWTMTTVGRLPQSWIGKWHHIAKFINNNVAPVIAASGVPITKASKASITSMSESKAKATDAARTAHEKSLWKKASESVITNFIFAENVEGGSQEALLCLQKCKVKWGDWDTIDEAVLRIATNEKSRLGDDGDTARRKLKIQIFFAEDDEMVGKGGQAYLEECFAKAEVTEYLDSHSEVVPGTDHSGVLRASKGAIGKVMREIGITNEEHAEPITLRTLLDSPMTPGSETTRHSRNRALSIRSRKKDDRHKEPSKHHFSIATLRGVQQAELSKKLFKIIKTENHAIDAYETAGRERLSVASQLSDWGESTNDDSISDISDKLGVLMSEIGEQEDLFAQNLEDYRAILKQIRNTESSVQPSRDNKAKISDEIQKLKYKEPTSPKLVTLEQELVRAEAQNLVAEAQLTNITRAKLKEAYDLHFAATIERAEKQIILAKYGRRLLNYLDDTPVVPGDVHRPFAHVHDARQVLSDAEQELQMWQPNLEPVRMHGGLGANLMPNEETSTVAGISEAGTEMPHSRPTEGGADQEAPALHQKAGEREHLEAAT